MFSSKKTEEPLVGAEAKQATARKMREAASADLGLLGEEPLASQTVLVTLVFALCVIFAFLQTSGDLTNANDWHPTGVPNFDNFLVGAGVYKFMGDPDINQVLTIFARGFAFFVITGIIPLFGFISVKALGKGRIHPLVGSWIAGAVLLLVYGLFNDSLKSLLASLTSGL